jgi:hypothetical protein
MRASQDVHEIAVEVKMSAAAAVNVAADIRPLPLDPDMGTTLELRAFDVEVRNLVVWFCPPARALLPLAVPLVLYVGHAPILHL